MTTIKRDRIYRTETIVLDRFDYGETDRIFTLFSRDQGKFKAIGKGVRRPTSKLAPALEYFSRCRLVLSKGRDLDVITSAETLHRPKEIGNRVVDFSYSSHLVEITNRLIREGQELPAVYDLLVVALDEIERGDNNWLVARWFELAMLTMTGYRLELYRCINCQRELQAEPNYYSGRLEGLLCAVCRQIDAGARSMSVNAQKFMRTLDRHGFQRTKGLRIDSATGIEVESVLGAHIRGVAEREFTSLRVLREIRETAPHFDF
jgi:DNA repair protein RecO (recombination protein O)